jgi:hypothetical protein
MSARTPEPVKQKWYVQLRETYTFTKAHVPGIGIKMLGLFVGIFALFLAIGFVTDNPIILGIFGFGFALLATTFAFGKVAERAAYASIDGQMGAAASVLNTLRGGWFTTPAVGVDKAQNLVHRVVGRPGIILVAEGSRPAALLAEQRKAHQRIVPGVIVHEVIVGEGGVTLNDLNKTVRKFKKSLRPAEVTELRRRVEAMPKNILPIPKGPMPQGRKIPRR